MSEDEELFAILNEYRDALDFMGRANARTALQEVVGRAVADAVKAERERCLALVKYRWTFDNDQQHTHSWHAMADTLRDIMNGTAAPNEWKGKK